MRASVADALCRTLEQRGVRHVFGLPGTETIDLWAALRGSTIRTVVGTSELMSSFTAIGYARASGRVGVLTTIGGAGFTYALSGIAEARLDSVPLVHVVAAPRVDGPGASGTLAQLNVARETAKAVIEVADSESAVPALDDALHLAASGEPGPMVVQVAQGVLGAAAASHQPLPERAPPATEGVAEVVHALRAARRPMLFCGLGSADAAAAVVRIAEALPAPVLTTTSGRGVIPETHPSSLAHDVPGAGVGALNEALSSADLVLILGCKLSHNGTRGHSLRLPAERLVRVDSSADVMGGAYPARIELVCDARAVAETIVEELERDPWASEWGSDELGRLRNRLARESQSSLPEPDLGGVSAASFLASVRGALPDETVVTTDSGLHQYLVRSHLPVLAPRTLVVPADFQSMGFGVPAAIGAALARDAPAVAVIGDGGLNMMGLELLTAVRESVPLVVVAIVDRQLGLIRAHQLRRTGRPTGVDVATLDVELFARSVGANYLFLPDGDPSMLGSLLSNGGVTLVEVPAGDTPAFARARAQGLVLAAGRRTLGPGLVSRTVRALRRRPG